MCDRLIRMVKAAQLCVKPGPRQQRNTGPHPCTATSHWGGTGEGHLQGYHTHSATHGEKHEAAVTLPLNIPPEGYFVCPSIIFSSAGHPKPVLSLAVCLQTLGFNTLKVPTDGIKLKHIHLKYSNTCSFEASEEKQKKFAFASFTI